MQATSHGDSVAVNEVHQKRVVEITRLAHERKNLMKTGCFSEYDHVIQEITHRIANLAQDI